MTVDVHTGQFMSYSTYFQLCQLKQSVLARRFVLARPISNLFLPLKSREICVGGSGTHVVQEGQVLRDVLGGPGEEVGVEKTLVTTVERPLRGGVLREPLVSVLRRTEHKHAGIEAVRPTGVRSRGKLGSIEELVAVFHHLKI